MAWFSFLMRDNPRLFGCQVHFGTARPPRQANRDLTIPFEKGVCGKCAREGNTQIVADVLGVPYHMACSSATRSEIVVAVLDTQGRVRAVLDVDSDAPGAFDRVDAYYLEELAH